MVTAVLTDVKQEKTNIMKLANEVIPEFSDPFPLLCLVKPLNTELSAFLVPLLVSVFALVLTRHQSA